MIGNRSSAKQKKQKKRRMNSRKGKRLRGLKIQSPFFFLLSSVAFFFPESFLLHFFPSSVSLSSFLALLNFIGLSAQQQTVEPGVFVVVGPPMPISVGGGEMEQRMGGTLGVEGSGGE